MKKKNIMLTDNVLKNILQGYPCYLIYDDIKNTAMPVATDLAGAVDMIKSFSRNGKKLVPVHICSRDPMTAISFLEDPGPTEKWHMLYIYGTSLDIGDTSAIPLAADATFRKQLAWLAR